MKCAPHGTEGVKPVAYVGGVFEMNLSTGEVTKYYLANGERVAMRTVPGGGGAGVVRYLARDHLGAQRS